MTGWLPVVEDYRRQPEAVPLAVIYGTAPGPAIYLQAVSDGDELNGLEVCRRILVEVRPADLSGALVIVPVANPGALRHGTAADPRDGRKLNRCFPGVADGSVTERLAWQLFHQLVLACDAVIDLHQNGATPMIPEVRVRTGRRGPQHAESLELALAFGLPHILDQQGPVGQLARAAPARGIPTIDPELGGNPGIDPAMVELGVAGVLNVLRHYRMLPGEPARATPFIARRLVPLHAPTGGLIRYLAELGDHLLPGQSVAEVTDVFGGQPALVQAPTEGVFWIRRREPVVAAGQQLGVLGVDHERNPL